MISHVFFFFASLFFWGLFALFSVTWFMSLLTISPGIRRLRSDLLAPFAIRPLYCISLLGWWGGGWVPREPRLSPFVAEGRMVFRLWEPENKTKTKKQNLGVLRFFGAMPEFNAHLAENRRQFHWYKASPNLHWWQRLTANNSEQTGCCFSRGFFKCRFSAARALPSETRAGRNLTDGYF